MSRHDQKMVEEGHILLDRTPSAPGAARRFVSAQAPPKVSDDAALLVSELVTNAVLHGSGESVEVGCELEDDSMHVTVSHQGAFERRQLPSLEGGQGLRILNQVARKWGIETSDEQVRIWFLL